MGVSPPGMGACLAELSILRGAGNSKFEKIYFIVRSEG